MDGLDKQLRIPKGGAEADVFNRRLLVTCPDGRPTGEPAWQELPPLSATDLGSRAFRAAHGVRLAYQAGAMAGGIASVELVVAMAKARILASFGAAGLPTDAVVEAASTITREAGPGAPFAINLIHQPHDPAAEDALIERVISIGVTTIEASAFMELAPAIVRFRAAGLTSDPASPGHRVLVKLSHPRTAKAFLLPPPAELLQALVVQAAITTEQAALAATLPTATDVTIEGDSGGHTDRRPLMALFPTLAELRERLARDVPAVRGVRLGAAGGIGTPSAVAAAFSLGADYVVTGSINQACREAGTSALVKAMLAEAGIDDTAMAPAADMFELGAQVQVLKRGTLFAMRAGRLAKLYREYDSLEELPDGQRRWLEREVLRQPVDAVWAEVERYFADRNPMLLVRAAQDPKLRMALVFRWYLGRSSDWARAGAADRCGDLQIWCGPAMGAFNIWVAGTRFADPAARSAVDVAEALMAGAAHLTQVTQARAAGRDVPEQARLIGPEQALAIARRAKTPAPALPLSTTTPNTETTPPRGGEDAAAAAAAGAIRDFLIEAIAAQLELSEEDIDPRETLDAYQIDSAKVLIVIAQLEHWLGRRLSPTLVWNYPTIDALADRLASGDDAA